MNVADDVKQNYVILQRSVPGYRVAFFQQLHAALDGRLVVASGDSSNPLEGAGVPWRRAPLLEWRIVYQWVPLSQLISAKAVVFELNPRALSTWIYILLTRLTGRKAIVWGHRDSRRGTRPWVRRFLDRLSDVSVYYTDAEVGRASRRRVEGRKVLAAPNTLLTEYRNSDLQRNGVILSARLVPEKDPLLAVHAVAASGISDVVLHIIGDGPLLETVAEEAERLCVDVSFHGAVYDPTTLAHVYQGAFAAVSPGCVGLSLNQSVLSGVPLVYRGDARHGPEVHYANEHNSVAIVGADPKVWGRVLLELREGKHAEVLPPDSLAAVSQRDLGLHAMVSGMREALLGVR